MLRENFLTDKKNCLRGKYDKEKGMMEHADRTRTTILYNQMNDRDLPPKKVGWMRSSQRKKGDRENSMDIGRVTENIRYLEHGFTILVLGNWNDGPEGVVYMGVRWKVEATGQDMVVRKKLEK